MHCTPDAHLRNVPSGKANEEDVSPPVGHLQRFPEGLAAHHVQHNVDAFWGALLHRQPFRRRPTGCTDLHKLPHGC